MTEPRSKRRIPLSGVDQSACNATGAPIVDVLVRQLNTVDLGVGGAYWAYDSDSGLERLRMWQTGPST
jgi:hypothetical protein